MSEISPRQRLLHVIPYDKFVPPQNGGALRCYHLCKELSKHFEVTLLTFQDKTTFHKYDLGNVNIINPNKKIEFKGIFNRLSNALKYRFYLKTFKGPAEATILGFYPVLKQLSKNQSFDYVLMEHLSSIALGKALKQFFPTAIRLADQHNIDNVLYRQNNDLSNKQYLKSYRLLKQQEEEIYKKADYILACSDYDLNALKVLNKNKIYGFVVPNGTVLNSNTTILSTIKKPSILFCGSLDYPPNKNGLIWFYHQVWPKLKKSVENITLTVIGRNGQDKAYDLLKEDLQINFIGEVEVVAPYYLESHIAIVPLLEGSGTRLKILEAMSFGVPVISTRKGAEGINYTDKHNIIIIDNHKLFADGIIYYLSQLEELKIISENGKLLIKKNYDWVKIGNDLSEKLNTIR